MEDDGLFPLDQKETPKKDISLEQKVAMLAGNNHKEISLVYNPFTSIGNWKVSFVSPYNKQPVRAFGEPIYGVGDSIKEAVDDFMAQLEKQRIKKLKESKYTGQL